MPDNSRRDFVKKAMYVAPVVLTLAAAPDFAKAGSDNGKGKDRKDQRQRQPRTSKTSPSPVTDARWLG